MFNQHDLRNPYLHSPQNALDEMKIIRDELKKIRDETIEECAKIVDEHANYQTLIGHLMDDSQAAKDALFALSVVYKDIAAKIRALKEKS